MKYEVMPVEDGELPAGVHSAIVERPDAPPLLLIAGDVAECWYFMREWENTREPAWQPTVTIPVRPLRRVG